MGGGTKTVEAKIPNATAEEQALYKLVNSYDQLSSQQGIDITKQAYDKLNNVVDTDWQSLDAESQAKMNSIYNDWNDLYQGKLNDNYQSNMENSLQRGYENTLGSSINSLGNRGVLNSKVTNSAINTQQKNLASQMAQSYQGNLSLQKDALAGKENNVTQMLSNAKDAQSASLMVPSTYYTIGSTLAGNAQNDWQTMYNARYKLASPTQTVTSGSVLGGVVSGLSSAFCFTGNTLISTRGGDIPIKEISVGDEVLAVDKDNNPVYVEVLAVSEPMISLDQYIQISSKDSSIVTTATQPFALESDVFMADELLEGDTLVTKDGFAEITDITFIDDKELVYDITVDGDNNYFANGFLVFGGEYK